MYLIYLKGRKIIMENNVNKVIQYIKNVYNSTVKEMNLSFYCTDCLKTHKMSIYEAYLLQGEVVN